MNDKKRITKKLAIFLIIFVLLFALISNVLAANNYDQDQERRV